MTILQCFTCYNAGSRYSNDEVVFVECNLNCLGDISYNEGVCKKYREEEGEK